MGGCGRSGIGWWNGSMRESGCCAWICGSGTTRTSGRGTEARRRQQPHPPTQFTWLTQLRFPVEREWTEREIEEALAEIRERAEQVEWGHELAASHDPAPPGYGDTDYDFQDWFMDFRHGLWWLQKP